MDYLRPTTISETVAALSASGGAATLIAGGTDLIADMKFRGFKPSALVNINQVEGLRYIEEDASGLRIGALTNVQAFIGNPVIEQRYSALLDSAERFASLQVRNLATVAGSLGRASPGGDIAPPLLALGAIVVVASADGERQVPLADFFLGPRRTVLRPTELMREIRIPALPPRTGSAYARLSYRDVLDLCIVGVAACVTLDAENRVTAARIALGSVAPRPVRAPKTEAYLAGRILTDDVIAEAGRVSSGDASPISDQRASAEYRRLMMPVLTRRSLTRARDAALAGAAATRPHEREGSDR
jgi:carbon-monoxide dehydrogenase medium subunit